MASVRGAGAKWGSMGDAMVGRSVIVTGGTRGIGYGIAEVFAQAGAHVTIVGRDRDVAAEAVARLTDGGASVDSVVADVSRPAECARMADEVMAARGAIDVLCANAGIFPSKRLEEMTEADYDETFDLNMKGYMFSVKACLPGLSASGHGRVVVTSSITGPMTGIAGWTHYGGQQGGATRLRSRRGDGVGATGDNGKRGASGHHPQRRLDETGHESRRCGRVNSFEAARRSARHRSRGTVFRQRSGRLYHRPDTGHRWWRHPDRIAEPGPAAANLSEAQLGDHGRGPSRLRSPGLLTGRARGKITRAG